MPSNIFLDCRAAFASNPLPQGKRGLTKNQAGYQAASRWTLISAPH